MSDLPTEPRFVDAEKRQIFITLPSGKVHMICDERLEPKAYKVLAEAITSNASVIEKLTRHRQKDQD